MTPVLTLVTNDTPDAPMSGRDVIAKLAPVIAEHLPAVPADDPFRTLLERLLTDARRRERTGCKED